MADWLDEPEDDSEDTTGVAQALADPRGTFGGSGGEVPDKTPEVDEQPHESSAPDTNADGDYEASKLAGGPQQDVKNESSVREDTMPFLPPGADDASDHSGVQPGDPVDEAMTPGSAPAAAPSSADDPYSSFNLKAPAVPQAPNLPDAQDERDQLAHQIASFNPNDYKPSAGRRALAAIAGGLTAFGSRSPEAGMRVGESVLDAPLNQARAAEDQTEAGMRQKIAATEAQRQDQQQDYNNQVTNYNLQDRNMSNQARVAQWQARAQELKAVAQQKLSQVDPRTLGPVNPNDPFGEWQGRNAKGEVIRGLEPPPAVQKDPRYISQQRRADMAQMAKDGIKLTPQESKFYLINGKLAEPSQHTTISIREGDSPAARQQQVSDIVAKATQDKQVFIDGWHRVANEDEAKELGAPVGSYVRGSATLSPEAFRDRIDKFRTDANVKLNRFGANIDEQGQLHLQDGRQAQSNPGSGKTFSISRWQAANPRGDVNAARQAAISQGYKMVP